MAKDNPDDKELQERAVENKITENNLEEALNKDASEKLMKEVRLHKATKDLQQELVNAWSI